MHILAVSALILVALSLSACAYSPVDRGMDLDRGAVARPAHRGVEPRLLTLPVKPLAVGPHGRHAVVADQEASYLWDLRHRRPTVALDRLLTGQLLAARFDTAGDLVLTASWSPEHAGTRATLISLSKRTAFASTTIGSNVPAELGFSHGGLRAHAVVNDPKWGGIWLVSWTTAGDLLGAVQIRDELLGQHDRAALSPDGSLLLVASDDRSSAELTVYDVPSGQLVARWTTASAVGRLRCRNARAERCWRRIHVDAQRREVFVATSGSRTGGTIVEAFDLDRGTHLVNAEVGVRPVGFTWDSPPRLLAGVTNFSAPFTETAFVQMAWRDGDATVDDVQPEHPPLLRHFHEPRDAAVLQAVAGFPTKTDIWGRGGVALSSQQGYGVFLSDKSLWISGVPAPTSQNPGVPVYGGDADWERIIGVAPATRLGESLAIARISSLTVENHLQRPLGAPPAEWVPWGGTITRLARLANNRFLVAGGFFVRRWLRVLELVDSELQLVGERALPLAQGQRLEDIVVEPSVICLARVSKDPRGNQRVETVRTDHRLREIGSHSWEVSGRIGHISTAPGCHELALVRDGRLEIWDRKGRLQSTYPVLPETPDRHIDVAAVHALGGGRAIVATESLLGQVGVLLIHGDRLLDSYPAVVSSALGYTIDKRQRQLEVLDASGVVTTLALHSDVIAIPKVTWLHPERGAFVMLESSGRVTLPTVTEEYTVALQQLIRGRILPILVDGADVRLQR